MYDDNRITYFAETDSRSKKIRFGIKASDRTRHVYVIGKTGMGKSTLLENMAIQDLRNGEGMAFIDPHGKTADFLLEFVPKERIKDVLYFAPFDIDNPISFNIMEDVGPDKRHLVVSGLMSAFKKLFGEESFSDRMQYILQNAILALLEYPGATMLGINRMLTDKKYRKKVVDNVTDASVKAYWTQEFANYTERFAAEATPAIQNKIGQFTSNPLIRNIIGQPKSSFDIRKIMDEGKIIILNLSKGKVGEANANLLGSMLITKIYLAAMSRADVGEAEMRALPNFYLYVDEFQSFANESFANILSEARKYKLNLTIAHQYIEQMSEEVRAAVFGNVGTTIAFRVGAFDADVLEKEFAPQFIAEDLVNLGFAQIYLKLMIDGVGSQPFSATTLAPFAPIEASHKDELIALSQQTFAEKRSIVEERINAWHNGDGSVAREKKPIEKSMEKPVDKLSGNTETIKNSQKNASPTQTPTHQKQTTQSTSRESTPERTQTANGQEHTHTSVQKQNFSKTEKVDSAVVSQNTAQKSDRTDTVETSRSSQPSTQDARTKETVRQDTNTNTKTHQPFADLLKQVAGADLVAKTATISADTRSSEKRSNRNTTSDDRRNNTSSDTSSLNAFNVKKSSSPERTALNTKERISNKSASSHKKSTTEKTSELKSALATLIKQGVSQNKHIKDLDKKVDQIDKNTQHTTGQTTPHAASVVPQNNTAVETIPQTKDTQSAPKTLKEKDTHTTSSADVHGPRADAAMPQGEGEAFKTGQMKESKVPTTQSSKADVGPISSQSKEGGGETFRAAKKQSSPEQVETGPLKDAPKGESVYVREKQTEPGSHMYSTSHVAGAYVQKNASVQGSADSKERQKEVPKAVLKKLLHIPHDK